MTRVGVDIGGTFTDLVVVAEDGEIDVRKVVTTPQDPSVGMFRAIETAGKGEGGKGKPIELLVHGTTIATNALLERRGARVVLVTTRGFEDLLWLRRQDRAALYDLARDHAPPLVARGDVIGVAERMGPAGAQEPLTDAEIDRVVAAARALAPESVAVAFLFAFRHPEHERRVATALRSALAGVPVAASHEVLPVFREFERISTTTVEAYLRPKVSAYLARLDQDARSRGVGTLRIMTSAGGTLAPAPAACRAATLALSGPAGGVVGARLVGAVVGLSELLTLDMGGTSADASLVTGGAAVQDGAGAVAGVPLALPSILIETVSAGGGSIARVDQGGALKVGPDSAGAVPGPACYGRGGTRPTVTDACLVLGWLDAASPLADEVRLDPAAARRAVAALGETAGSDPAAIAAGIVAVATAVMARALRRVSVARGLDPRRVALVPFGGAGPLFGCALADALGMRTVVIPPHPGVLSALGLAAAGERVDLLASHHRELDRLQPTDIGRAFSALLREASEQLPGGALWRYADCRFVGQGYEVTIPVTTNNPRQIRDAFLAAHRERFGHSGSGQPVELVNLRVVAVREAPLPRFGERGGATRECRGERPVALGRGRGRGGKRVTASLWALDDLAVGVTLDGPAILAGRDATALIEPGWRGAVHASGAVVVERV
ncbi:MAG TPA: hydantoinase/oxoprolinase family protein [Gemmatimonadales bacterium]|nr:hydantoinase/oxoprolinase family protein [Gemmatimonadales bacterium]